MIFTIFRRRKNHPWLIKTDQKPSEIISRSPGKLPEWSLIDFKSFDFFMIFIIFSSFSGHVWQNETGLDSTKWAETFQKPRLIPLLNPALGKSLDSIGFPVEVSLASQLRGVGKFSSISGFSSIRANFRHPIFSKSASHHFRHPTWSLLWECSHR